MIIEGVVRSIGSLLLLDCFAMAQSTPSDLYFQPTRYHVGTGQRGARISRERDNTAAKLRYNGV